MNMTTDARQKAISLLLDIEENETVMRGRSSFEGSAQLKRVIRYLVDND